jgi:hypothetical protein
MSPVHLGADVEASHGYVFPAEEIERRWSQQLCLNSGLSQTRAMHWRQPMAQDRAVRSCST